MHVLPPGPGEVILVTELQGEPVDPPVLAVSEFEAGSPASRTRWMLPNSPLEMHQRDDQITGWLPAAVVRDDDEGPVAALGRILARCAGDSSALDVREAVQREAARALNALDPSEPPW